MANDYFSTEGGASQELDDPARLARREAQRRLILLQVSDLLRAQATGQLDEYLARSRTAETSFAD